MKKIINWLIETDILLFIIGSIIFLSVYSLALIFLGVPFNYLLIPISLLFSFILTYIK